MADRPRTFEEVAAAQGPADRERWERGDTFKDAGVENDFHADIHVQEDREHPGEWRVEYSDGGGGGRWRTLKADVAAIG
jgi:hypothetical protein